MLKDKNIDSPILMRNQQTVSLEVAKEELLRMLNELSVDANLSEDEIREVVKMIELAYVKKKASYLLEGKVDNFFKYLSESCDFALNSNKKIFNNDYTEFTFLNHTKKLLANEQY